MLNCELARKALSTPGSVVHTQMDELSELAIEPSEVAT